MARESVIPQQLMTGALLHFESGVPISDLDVRREHKDRLVRVQHVYWQWVRNPFLDTRGMFRQLIRNGEKKYADAPSEFRAIQKDQWLFDFVVDHVSPPSRRVDEAKVRKAAEQAIRIGMETDNVQALTKGGKLLYEVAGLDKPEDNKADISKVAFLPSVVVTNVKEVDETKENIDDAETRRIAAKYGAYIDEKRTMIEEQVTQMEARAGIGADDNQKEQGDE